MGKVHKYKRIKSGQDLAVKVMNFESDDVDEDGIDVRRKYLPPEAAIAPKVEDHGSA